MFDYDGHGFEAFIQVANVYFWVTFLSTVYF